MDDSFTLISLNVKGIAFFLQETHSTVQTDTQWKNEWGAELHTSHGTSNSRGVAIMIKSGFDCTVCQKIVDPLGRYIILKAAFGSGLNLT